MNSQGAMVNTNIIEAQIGKTERETIDKDLVVNYHINESCNYKCHYCYAYWEGKGKKKLHTNLIKAKKLLSSIYHEFMTISQYPEVKDDIYSKNIRLNIVGGEPTMVKNFMPILKIANRIGFKVGIVTNGSLIDEKFITNYSKYLCVIGFSIDAITKDLMLKIGRATCSGQVLNIDNLYRKIELLRSCNPNIKIKINTVVNQYNFDHDIRPFLYRVNPDKWKVFRVLPNIRPETIISDDQFSTFLENHRELSQIMYPEDNDVMVGSYIMVDPLGRFIDNSCIKKNRYFYSAPILEVGALRAFKMINVDMNKFWNRYDRVNLKLSKVI